MSEQLIEALAWIAAIAGIVAVFWLVARDNERRRRRTVEEFERDVEESRGSLLSAGVLGLEKILSDGKRAAVEYREDERQGATRTGSQGDDADRTSEEERT